MSGKDNMDKQYTYTELLKAADSFIKKIDNFIGKAINFAKSHNRKNYLKLQIDSESPKKEAEIMEYQTNTRQNHALALVVANTIYFRNGAYKPETEEGRKLLAHELTHVAQYAEKRMLRQTDRKELEAEAKEVQQEYNPDPEIVIKIKGKYERIRKSKIKRKKEIGLFNKHGNKIKTR